MTFHEYLKMAGSIRRMDANYYFLMHDETLAAMVRRGELDLLPDLFTPFGDLFRLKHPEQISAIDLRGRIVQRGRFDYRVVLDRLQPGMWRLERVDVNSKGGSYLYKATTRHLLHLLGLARAA